MAGGNGSDPDRGRVPPAQPARPRPAFGLPLRLGSASRRCSTTRRLDRLRAGRWLLLLLAAAMNADGVLDRRRRAASCDRPGLVRPPVGRLHRGRRRRLGLVRGEPRRRHRPDACRSSAMPTAPTRSSTGRSPAPTGRTSHLPPRGVHDRGHRPLDKPGDRRDYPGRLADHGPGRGSRDRPRPDGRRPGARHPRIDRGRLLGGIAGRLRLHATGCRSAARPTSS